MNEGGDPVKPLGEMDGGEIVRRPLGQGHAPDTSVVEAKEGLDLDEEVGRLGLPIASGAMGGAGRDDNESIALLNGVHC